MRIETRIKTALAAFRKEEALEKKLEQAEWNNKPTARIESAIKTANSTFYAQIDALADAELSGVVIDYTAVSGSGGLCDFVGECIQERV